MSEEMAKGYQILRERIEKLENQINSQPKE
jgi:hypothetical protein